MAVKVMNDYALNTIPNNFADKPRGGCFLRLFTYKMIMK